jgi:long-subunit fatty acid transport protein
LLALLFLGLPAVVVAQTPNTSFTQTAPPAPVGSGARAMGTGGAYIAIADDATAANWNPAGLIQLVKPELSFAANYEERRLPGDSSLFGGVDYISGVLPFNVGEVNMVLSINYQRRWDFYFDSKFESQVDRTNFTAAEIQFLDPVPGATDSIAIATFNHDVFGVSGVTKKLGSLEALSPAFAIQIAPTFSVGVTYNFWSDSWLAQPYTQEYREHQTAGTTYIEETGMFGEIPPSCRCVDGGGASGPCDDTQYVYIQNPGCLDVVSTVDLGSTTLLRDAISVEIDEKIDMQGQNFNLGFLWKITPRWTLGGVYRSEFIVDMNRELTFQQTQPRLPKMKWDDDIEMRMPASYGLGGAFRYSDRFSLAADLSVIEWNRFQLSPESGDPISPVNGLPTDKADIDPTLSARLGGEYLILNPKYIVPIRAGLFYDPEPARGTPDDYYGVTIGTGIVYEPVVVDLSYWYRFGNDVTLYTGYNKLTGEINEVEGDVHRQMVMLSMVLYLK